MVQQAVYGIGGLEHRQTLVEHHQKLPLNLLQRLLLGVQDVKQFIKFFAFQH
jgi:hypothetical protein